MRRREKTAASIELACPGGLHAGGGLDSGDAVFDGDSFFGEEADGFGVGDAFFFEHAGGQCVGVVAGLDLAASLDNDGPLVVFAGAEVDGTAADLAAGRKHRLVNVVAPHAAAAERRQERGVDVHDAALVFLRDQPQAQPAGLDDQVNPRRIEHFADAIAELADVGVILLADDRRPESEFTGAPRL